MSGSPVIVTPINGYITDGGGIINNGVRKARFIGVYSGRILDPKETPKSEEEKYQDTLFRAQIGIVWKEKVIQEIIDGKVPGKSQFL